MRCTVTLSPGTVRGRPRFPDYRGVLYPLRVYQCMCKSSITLLKLVTSDWCIGHHAIPTRMSIALCRDTHADMLNT